MPSSSQENLDPRAEIAWGMRQGQANITDVPSAIPSGDVEAPTERDR